MSLQAHPAEANIRTLEQGIELVRRIDDELFTAAMPAPFRGGVGSQLRHCIDFYECFLAGLDTGRVDYGARRRDPQMAADREYAARAAGAVVRDLRGLPRDILERELEVRGDAPQESADAGWTRSSAGRELQFLTSHTVHHYALIASLLSRLGFDVQRQLPGFGVGSSTLEHWTKVGSVAR